MHAGFRRGLGFFAMWTAIGLLSAAQTWIDGRYTNEPLVWTQASLLGLSQWYTWGVLSFPLFAQTAAATGVCADVPTVVE